MTSSQTEKKEITEYRHNRNWVRIGDPVKAKPTGRTTFDTRVHRIVQLGSGLIEIEVVDPYTKGIRTVTPSAITRKSVSRSE